MLLRLLLLLAVQASSINFGDGSQMRGRAIEPGLFLRSASRTRSILPSRSSRAAPCTAALELQRLLERLFNPSWPFGRLRRNSPPLLVQISIPPKSRMRARFWEVNGGRNGLEGASPTATARKGHCTPKANPAARRKRKIEGGRASERRADRERPQYCVLVSFLPWK